MGSDLGNDVNEFMEDHYGNLEVATVHAPKIIHMTTLGTNYFSQHEIATIDLPVVQRLKYISQLGSAYNVFPTARHTRFEHSLGVTIMVKKMWDSLIENNSLEKTEYNDPANLNNLRLAAILHDIGHGPFSHSSEIALKIYPSIKKETSKLNDAKPHEILGYYMIKSDIFKTFLEQLSKKYKIEELDADVIANFIIGRAKNYKQEQYLADLINGPIDADKLDYIIRDSDFSGVPLSIGIDRLLLSLGVEEIGTPDGECKKIILNEKGIIPFEQLLYSKIMLYSCIYYHQKVRALDSMISAILRMIIESQEKIGETQIDSPCDFLKLDDSDLLKFPASNDKLKNLCTQLKRRNTFKRSLVLSSRTIGNDSNGVNRKTTNSIDYGNQFLTLIELGEDQEDLWKLNKLLAYRIGNKCTEFDVSIDVPLTPSLGASSQRIIKIDDEFKELKEIFPEKGWLDSYMSNKWTGHIFASPNYRKQAQEEGKNILEEFYGIKLNKYAFSGAKILDSDLSHTVFEAE